MTATSGPLAFVSDATVFGGSEVYLATLAAALSDRYKIVAAVGDTAPPELRRRLGAAGVHVEVVAGLTRRPRVDAVVRLVRLLRELRPSLVHVNAADQGGGSLGIVAARLCGRPLVVTVHLIVGPRRRPARLSRWTLGRAHAVITVSDGVAAGLAEDGLRPVVVPNGVPVPQLAAEPRRELELGDEAFVVGGVGRLDKQKGWDILCRAAPVVRERVPGATFIVIGDGPQRAALERCADIRLAGYRESAASLLGAFDVLVIPSRYEGMPLVCIEAMHAGLAIVAARVGGLPATLEETGVLVAPEQPDELAAAVIGLAEDAELRSRLGDSARRRAGERFVPERMADETVAVYRSVTCQDHAP